MQLEIRYAGGHISADPARHTIIGSDPTNAVTLSHPNVHGNHATVAFDGTNWRLVDTSGGGIVVNGAVVSDMAITEPTWAWIGAGENGEYVELVPEGNPAVKPAVSAAAPAAVALPSEYQQTAIIVGGDKALRLRSGDDEYTYQPGRTVTIGRTPECDIAIDSPIVSRQHLRFDHDGTNWVMTDLGSSGGTFQDGRRLKGSKPAKGAYNLFLGDDDAGSELRVIAPGVNRQRRNLAPLLLGAAALLVALVAVGLILFLGGDEEEIDPEVVAAQQRTATKLATVGVGDETSIDFIFGTGTIIAPDLVLTNAHVADPTAEGLLIDWENPGGNIEGDGNGPLIIHISPEEDAPAVPVFTAELVATDAAADLAIIRATGRVDGGEFNGDMGITPVPIGDSDTLVAGTEIELFGFPGIAGTMRVSVTRGVFQSFQPETRLGEQAVLNSDVASAGGNSGGPATVNGEIVGVLFATRANAEDVTRVTQIRPINFAKDMLGAVEDGRSYSSPFIVSLTGSETISSVGFAPSANANCGQASTTFDAGPIGGEIFVALQGENMTDRTHVMVVVQHDVEDFGVIETFDWPAEVGPNGCFVYTMDFAPADVRPEGDWLVGVLIGPNFDEEVFFDCCFEIPG